MNIDAVIDSALAPIADKVSGLIFSYITIGEVKVEFLVALLIFAALFFTIRTGFIGIWGFKHAVIRTVIKGRKKAIYHLSRH